MKIYCKGSARIAHKVTGKQFEIFPDELDWEPIGGSEGGMGPEHLYAATVSHAELGELSWLLSEYPAGAEGFSQTDIGEHELLRDFDYGLEHEPEDGFEDISNEAQENTAPTSEEMFLWFHQFYEDPQNDTPYNSEDGMYVFVSGGPYDATDVLHDQFGDIATEAEIEKAVEEIEKGGTFEWAPTLVHPDQIAAADEYREQEERERRKGSGFYVNRETQELALNRRSFALALAQLFKSATGEFSFALLGPWGSGKTTVSDLVSDFLQDPNEHKTQYQKAFGADVGDDPEYKYKTVKFNAWRYRQKPEIWVYLYESFLAAFLDGNLPTRVLRSVRVGLHEHGVLPTFFKLFLLAFLAFPLMWISSLFPATKAVFGFSGIVGLSLLALRWKASLRQLYDQYGVVSSHSEHLGMQAVIGEDLKSLIRSQVKTRQFQLWEQQVLFWATLLIALAWLIITVLSDSDMTSKIPSFAGCFVWFSIGSLFWASTVTEFDRIDRILLIVDDLDRCPQEEILELIDGIKLMIDDEEIGAFVQALVLADSSILLNATANRFRNNANPRPEEKEEKTRTMEHLEKVFLCHVHLPENSEKDVDELVRLYAKEFGVEGEKDFYGTRAAEESLASPTTQADKPKSSDVEASIGGFVLSFPEVNSIRNALAMYCSWSGAGMTPRAVRSYLFRYQIVRMILQINNVQFDHVELAETLAYRIASSRGYKIGEDRIEGNQLDSYVRMVV